MIEISQFGGEFPRLSADKLPDGAAALTSNVDVTSNALKRLSVSATRFAMHDGTNLTQNVPDGYLTGPTQPSAPTRNTTPTNGLMKAQPDHWLTVAAKAYLTYYELTGDGDLLLRDSGSQTMVEAGSWAGATLQYTQSGFILTGTIGNITLSDIAFDVPHYITGPHWQLSVTDDTTSVQGGPDAAFADPASPVFTDAKIPGCQIPLYWSDGTSTPQVYAFLQLRDVAGPNWEKTITRTSGMSQSITLIGGTVVLTFDLNYIEPRQQAFRFVVSKVNSAGREGPYSDLSDLVIVNPGEVLEMTLGDAGSDVWRVYKTVPGGSDFYLMGDVDDTKWVDSGQPPLEAGLPPSGAVPAGTANATGTFAHGLSMHPGRFLVGRVDNTLYRSDIDKFHVFPPENSVTFTKAGEAGAADNILAFGISGNTIIVWTESAVYAIGGNDPTNASYYLLSGTAVLSGALGVTRLDNTFYWVCAEGLASSSGSGVEIATREHFTQAQWASAIGTLASAKAYSYDGAVYVEQTGKVRLDFKYGAMNAVTRYTALTNGTFLWKSKTYIHDRPVIYTHARVHFATAAPTMKLYIDGVEKAPGPPATSGLIYAMNNVVHGYKWTVELGGTTAEVEKVELFERQVIPFDGNRLTITPTMAPILEDIWVKFPNTDRICAAMLSYPATTADSETGTLAITTRDGTSLQGATSLTGGKVVALTRDTAFHDLVRLNLACTAQPESLTLYTRRIQPVSRTLRLVNTGGAPEWLYTRYELEGRAKIVGVQVSARDTDGSVESVSMRLYADGDDSATETVTVANGNPIRLGADAMYASSIEIDFTGEDHLVSEVILLVKEIIDVGPGPLRLTDPAQWVGSIFRFPDRGTWAAMSVGCNGSTTVNLYGDGSAKTWWRSGTATINTGNVQFLNRELTEHSLWEVYVDADEAPDHIILYPRTRMDAPVPFRLRADDTGVMRWAYGRFEFPDHFEPSSAVVLADSYNQTLNLYADGSATATVSSTVTAADEFPLHTLAGDTYTPMSRVSALDLDFGGTNDYLVNEVYVYGKQIEMLGAEEASWSQPPFRMRHVKLSQPGTITAVRVRASAAPTVQILSAAGVVLWNNGGSALTSDVVTGVLVSGDPLDDAYEFIVDTACAGEIYGVEVFPRQLIPAKNNGIILRNGSQVANWNQMRVEFPESGSFSVARLVLPAYSGASLKLTPDGTTEKTFSVSDNEDFKLLPSGSLLPYARQWDVSVVSAADVYELHLIGMQKHKLSGPVLTIRRGEGPFSWLAHDFYLDGRVLFNCARIKASSYPGVGPISFKVFDENLTTELFSMNVTSGAAFRLPGASIKPLRQGRVDVIPPEGVVIEEFSMATAMSRLGS